MKRETEKAAEWVYRGVWKALAGWFRVPERPPTLPVETGAFITSFHPSRRYLAYMKCYFWIVFIVVDVLILAGWTVAFLADPVLGLALALPALVLAVVPDVIAYVALHLRYDTMWYVMTDQSLRCRRGIWTILEHTITFENVQNVDVHRGPLQYFFGISTIVVETAGASEGEGENQFAVGNKAILEGIENPDEIRELIMERVRRSKSVGLGDDEGEAPGTGARGTPSWTPELLAALREVRDEAREMVGDS